MPHHALNSPPLDRLAVVAIGVTTAVTLTACTAETDTTNTADRGRTTVSASPAPTGVVTRQEASKILTGYENTNNRANKRRDARLLSTVEAGAVNVQSRADYEQFTTQSKSEQAEYGSPFRYVRRDFAIPRKGTATWFAVKATATGSQNPALLIFDKVDGTYKLVMALYSDKKAPIPELAFDKNGFVQPADPAKAVGDLAPNQLGDAFEDLVATGGKKSGTQFASTPLTKEAVKLYTECDKQNNSRYATNKYFAKPPKDPSVYALKLADGGVLAAFPSAHTGETMLRPAFMASYKINPTKREAIYNRTSRVVIVDEYQGQALAELPPTGKPRIISREYRMVDSR
ncbi:hypothetical protein ACFYPT_40885 [Streptomyces sp. NPDC005529]|uniref:hypothetical protein n=1 Tax=unclassified Streptomyces TaxID=2593676 RepID=UPI0033A821B4